MYIDDTIAAITTPIGVGGVAIIRVSGKDSFSIVNKIFQSKNKVELIKRENKTIHYGFITHQDVIIDEVLLLLMKGPQSYTAEDVVEIQCHGGLLPVKKILSLLLEKGCRLAEPGEFTKRAFLNGRIDLVQAEAVMDIIHAKTERSLELAVNQLHGKLHHLIRELRNELISIIAHMEVVIDYPEEDIEDITGEEAKKSLEPLIKKMEDLLKTSQIGKLLRDGIMVAIIGRPNAGKSSLLNTLLRENRAIVTDIPGTTRDSIEEYLDVEGVLLRLVDTAGIRKTEDIVERMGVEKAQEYLEKSDMLIVVLDGTKSLDKYEIEILEQASHKPSLVFINKRDKTLNITEADIKKYGNFIAIHEISASQGEGLKELTSAVHNLIDTGSVEVNNKAMLTNIRHIDLIKKAYFHLGQSLEAISFGLPIDCVVTDIRQSWELLGEINGDSIREDMTDELFKRFCLGK